MEERRVVLVTGGSGAIGGEICCQLADRSSIVAVQWHTNEGRAREIATTVRTRGGIPITIRADLRSTQAAESVIAVLLDAYGRLDVLVNAAGLIRSGLLATTTDEQLEEVLEVNFKSAFRVTRATIPHMMASHSGTIVNVSSMAASRPKRGYAHYAAAKAALEGFTRAMAVELAPVGIRVNAVSPGIVLSESTRDVRERLGRELLAEIPLRRFATTMDVARAVCFLSSRNAEYITGQILNVSGGR